MDCLLDDQRSFVQNGADGFVFGALRSGGRTIDAQQTERVLNEADGRPLTFSRAFDLTDGSQLEDNCRQLADIGVSRVLSSGLAPNAELGVSTLRRMRQICEGSNLLVMPGAGITAQNARSLLEQSGCVELHGSAKRQTSSCGTSGHNNGVDFGRTVHTDVDIVRQLVTIGRNYLNARKEKP